MCTKPRIITYISHMLCVCVCARARPFLLPFVAYTLNHTFIRGAKHTRSQPLLSAYEFEVSMKSVAWREVYPMDYYSKNGGSWTNYVAKADAASIVGGA